MRLDIPQYIESESKIAGSLTFKQLLYLVGAGGLVMFFYFTLAKTNLTAFIVITIILITVASIFAFLKINGYSFSIFIKNFLSFFISSKVYLWERKISPIKIIQIEKKQIKKTEEKATLKIAGKSQLKKLSSQIELNIK